MIHHNDHTTKVTSLTLKSQEIGHVTRKNGGADELTSKAARDAWTKNCKNVKEFVMKNNRSVVPGHLYNRNNMTTEQMLDHPIKYLTAYEKALQYKTGDKFWDSVMSEHADEAFCSCSTGARMFSTLLSATIVIYCVCVYLLNLHRDLHREINQNSIEHHPLRFNCSN